MNNEDKKPAPKRAIFLDRDGVMNVKLPEDHYVKELKEFTFLPNAVSALCILKNLGYLLVIVTNQRGIARGYMTEEDLKKVHDFMVILLKQEGAPLEAIYYCPHDTTDLCMCRKPRSGMIFNACNDLGINLADSFMVGDSPSDMAAGKNAGTRTVRIGMKQDPNADLTFPSLMDFAVYLKNQQEGSGSFCTATPIT
ncbi:MAG: D-glycero-D-manno-heptose 1,7-bisphosphate phosphatase [Thermodesulfobacteriota bacterium]|nr:D-glycero-D-manno-heptose 1,7-bisphosphate phosphatase [Thermodesulfobacteriota bacterium]